MDKKEELYRLAVLTEAKSHNDLDYYLYKFFHKCSKAIKTTAEKRKES